MDQDEQIPDTLPPPAEAPRALEHADPAVGVPDAEEPLPVPPPARSRVLRPEDVRLAARVETGVGFLHDSTPFVALSVNGSLYALAADGAREVAESLRRAAALAERMTSSSTEQPS